MRGFQGEPIIAADNKLLVPVRLFGSTSAPHGVPQIDVTFDIDANGIVNVSAKDKATNKEQSIRIQATGGLSEEDIQRMVAEAEARNHADAAVHTTEKALAEHGDKIDAADKTAIETAITELKSALEGA